MKVEFRFQIFPLSEKFQNFTLWSRDVVRIIRFQATCTPVIELSWAATCQMCISLRFFISLVLDAILWGFSWNELTEQALIADSACWYLDPLSIAICDATYVTGDLWLRFRWLWERSWWKTDVFFEWRKVSIFDTLSWSSFLRWRKYSDPIWPFSLLWRLAETLLGMMLSFSRSFSLLSLMLNFLLPVFELVGGKSFWTRPRLIEYDCTLSLLKRRSLSVELDTLLFCTNGFSIVSYVNCWSIVRECLETLDCSA